MKYCIFKVFLEFLKGIKYFLSVSFIYQCLLSLRITLLIRSQVIFTSNLLIWRTCQCLRGCYVNKHFNPLLPHLNEFFNLYHAFFFFINAIIYTLNQKNSLISMSSTSLKYWSSHMFLHNDVYFAPYMLGLLLRKHASIFKLFTASFIFVPKSKQSKLQSSNNTKVRLCKLLNNLC